MLLMRGPGGFTGGKVFDPHGHPPRHLPDALRPRRGRPPDFAAGHLADAAGPRRGRPPHDQIFAEVTFHAAYEPQRAVRTDRWKYIRRFDDYPSRCWPTATTAPRRISWSRRAGATAGRRGAALRPAVRPAGGAQPGGGPGTRRGAGRAARPAGGLDEETDDPLLEGPVPPHRERSSMIRRKCRPASPREALRQGSETPPRTRLDGLGGGRAPCGRSRRVAADSGGTAEGAQLTVVIVTPQPRHLRWLIGSSPQSRSCLRGALRLGSLAADDLPQAAVAGCVRGLHALVVRAWSRPRAGGPPRRGRRSAAQRPVARRRGPARRCLRTSKRGSCGVSYPSALS